MGHFEGVTSFEKAQYNKIFSANKGLNTQLYTKYDLEK